MYYGLLRTCIHTHTQRYVQSYEKIKLIWNSCLQACVSSQESSFAKISAESFSVRLKYTYLADTQPPYNLCVIYIDFVTAFTVARSGWNFGTETFSARDNFSGLRTKNVT